MMAKKKTHIENKRITSLLKKKKLEVKVEEELKLLMSNIDSEFDNFKEKIKPIINKSE